MAVALFLLGVMYLCTRNLDSKDTHDLISNIGTLHGLSWIGWIIAFIEIPIFKWALNRARRMNKNKVQRLEKELGEALELLKKPKQNELKLES